MFKLTPNPTFKAQVPLSIPGQARPASIEVEFRHLTRTEIHEFFVALPGKTDAAALGEIVVGWSGVDVPFSADALAMLLDNFSPAATELFEVFRKQATESRQKN